MDGNNGARNLDQMAALAAQDMVRNTPSGCDPSQLDNVATKSLGVLQENGVYAGFLYLYSRTQENERNIAKETRNRMLELIVDSSLLDNEVRPENWREGAAAQNIKAKDALLFVAGQISSDLDTLLMVKELLELTLTYLRYGAKAWNEEAKAKAKEEAKAKAEKQEAATP